MKRAVVIHSIGLDDRKRLYVRPDLPDGEDYSLVYRGASGVGWSVNNKALVAREPDRWSYEDLARQIEGAVEREYGDRLRVGQQTRWSGVPEELRKSLESVFAESPGSG